VYTLIVDYSPIFFESYYSQMNIIVYIPSLQCRTQDTAQSLYPLFPA